ncbi:hypothetical protein ABU614_08650 [Lysobacter firmicutimachus]|uniref:DUF3015 domain-containing protein n=1 Tax=Lysobacter firmicutimachus TaxID=1792846 RepID=A0AAU8MX34_9GAMM
MHYRTALLAIGLSLASLPAFSQSFVSSERYSDNPMNGVGVAHNAYTGCMAANYTGGGVSAHVENLVKRCGTPTAGDDAGFIRKHIELANATRGDTRLSMAENLRAYRSSFTVEQFAYFEDVDRILAEAANPEEADRGLKVLEDQAIKYLGRSDDDLAVLGAISTARHSTELWTQQNPIAASAQGKIPGWLQVAIADATGFVSGVKACGKLCGWVNAAIQSISTAFEVWGDND